MVGKRENKKREKERQLAKVCNTQKIGYKWVKVCSERGEEVQTQREIL